MVGDARANFNTTTSRIVGQAKEVIRYSFCMVRKYNKSYIRRDPVALAEEDRALCSACTGSPHRPRSAECSTFPNIVLANCCARMQIPTYRLALYSYGRTVLVKAMLTCTSSSNFSLRPYRRVPEQTMTGSSPSRDQAHETKLLSILDISHVRLLAAPNMARVN
jgi:hypothetical protein